MLKDFVLVPLTDEDWGKLTMAMGSLSNAGIFIDDTPGVRVQEIRSKCRRLKQEHGGLGMILIDYLQLILGSGRIWQITVNKKYRKFPVH